VATRSYLLALTIVLLGAQVSAQQTTPVDTLTSLMAKADAGTALTAEENGQVVQALKAILDSADIPNAKVIRYIQWAQRVLTAESKGELRTKLLDRLAGTEAKVAALVPAEVYSATIAFDQLAGQAEKVKMVMAWMGAGDGWKAATPLHLIRVLFALNAGKPEDVAQLKTAWVSHIWTTYLAPQADASKATGPEYAELAIQTHKLLSSEQQKQLADCIVPRLSKPETAAQLSMADIRKAEWTLNDLHKLLEVADIIAAWVANSQAWKQVGPADIGYLCDQLRPKEGLDGPKAAIAALVEQARARKLLSDTQTIIQNDPAQWIPMVRALRNYITEADRVAMTEQVKILFIQDRQRAGKLSASQLADLAETASYYGRRDQAGDVLVAWLAANDLAKLPPEQVAMVTACFEYAGSPEAAAKKASLGDIIWRDYLSRDEFLTQTPLEQLTAFAVNTRSVLSADQKAQVASKLAQRFAGDAGTVSTLTVSDTIRLCQAVVAMGKTADAAELVLRWIAACDAWKQAGTYEQQVLAGILKGGATDDTSAQAVQWALKVYNNQLSALKPDQRPETFTLARLAMFMKQMGMIGKGKGYPGYADALTAALKAGAKAGSREDCYALALPLGTPEAQGSLVAGLIDDSGQPRREVARVMAWVYYQYDSIDNWLKQLDAKLTDPKTAGDQKAIWLLTKADAGSVKGISWDDRKKMLDDAFATAAATSVKLDLAKEIALGYSNVGRPQDAIKYLDGIAGQFSDAAGKAALDAVRKQVQVQQATDAEESVAIYLKGAADLEAQARTAEAEGKLFHRDNLLRMAAQLRKEADLLRQK
jgi:hypothetical protein